MNKVENETLIAFHGSNRLFREFDLRYCFSGQGYALHGKGIYLTLDRKVATRYAKELSKRFLFSPDGSNRFDLSYGADLRSVDKAVAYALRSINEENCPEKETISGAALLLSYSSRYFSRELLEKQIQQRLKEVSLWKHNPGYVYTVEIDKRHVGLSAAHKAKPYVGREDGVCLLISDPDIIKITGVEKMEEMAL